MNASTPLAHPDQTLVSHLVGVAHRARSFAAHFGSEEQAELAGLLHDLGKAEPEFQKRIHKAAGLSKEDGKKQPHAHHGAALLLQDQERGGPVWPVAFAINGHHAGLHDRHNLHKPRTEYAKGRTAEATLIGSSEWKDHAWPISSFGKNLPEWLDNLPFVTPEQRSAKLRAVELYTRFLFSALVDADRLDTEDHERTQKRLPDLRRTWRFGAAALAAESAVSELLREMIVAIQKRREQAIAKGASGDVLSIRQEVLNHCTSAASKDRGIFSLSVPTGGGKTLASLDFALRHIQAQNDRTTEPHQKLRRIIVVIPYLSIIQQTAREMKNVFGELTDDGNPTEAEPVVLEHHSQAQDLPVDEKKVDAGKASDYSARRSLRQLAAENWDAPIVVTTTVQFFDSLFSRRPADARKLHNIAQSVIIFDEVQTFPPRLMQPILDVLGELTNPGRPYGCSLVLCTATQPALSREVNDEPWAFEAGRVRPIVPAAEATKHFRTLARVEYDWQQVEADTSVSWSNLAEQVLSESPRQRALVVVNTRRQARKLFDTIRERLGNEEKRKALFHLSTWMTPAHRVEVLHEVNRRLKAGEPCFLVSTQCIEAGVDVDFPAVWRALGPYDSIVQAAGRCNRSGALQDPDGQPVKGVMRVFRPEDHDKSMPQGVYQTATSQTELLRRMKGADPHNPDSFPQYFRLLYQLSVPDECEIQKHREQLHFEQVHECFDFIESFTVPVLVVDEVVNGQPRSTPAKAIYVAARQKFIPGSKQRGYFTRQDWRDIQPFILNLDYRGKQAQQALAKYAVTHAFDADDLELRIWSAGNGGYAGGFNGTGITFQPEFDQLLSGGL
ncbi:MAG: CRISPR-associated helicase Cas3' [Verrucomicrobia bacterium]|jgi:CRISPR-associated endonuclease/helicase Cas3|nr:CRISPR-associated helicase Cas3' [Verrucomicrobiota bacterium]